MLDQEETFNQYIIGYVQKNATASSRTEARTKDARNPQTPAQKLQSQATPKPSVSNNNTI